MTPSTKTISAPDRLLTASTDHRHVRRSAGQGDVWLVNHYGRTVLRCPCIDISPTGMRLHVPPGYGVAAGQHYEFSGKIPGEAIGPAMHPLRRHRGAIVWSHRRCEHGASFVDVGVAFESATPV